MLLYSFCPRSILSFVGWNGFLSSVDACSRLIGSAPFKGSVPGGIARGATARGWIGGLRNMSMLHGNDAAFRVIARNVTRSVSAASFPLELDTYYLSCAG